MRAMKSVMAAPTGDGRGVYFPPRPQGSEGADDRLPPVPAGALLPSSMANRIYLSPPHLGDDERKLVADAFDSNWIAPLGPHVDAFERELAERTGIGHAAALSSGTGAIHLALRILGVARGDQVVVSSLTFCGSVNPVMYEGAEPV